MDKDFILIRVGWFTQLEGRVTSVKEIHASHRALVFFLQDNGLTIRTILSKDELLNDNSQIMRSDLTEKGFIIYQKAEQKWLRGLDRGNAPDDMRVFEKELAKLNSKSLE